MTEKSDGRSLNYSRTSKSSLSVDYGTPLDFFSKLNDIFHFEFDPCAFDTNTLQMHKFYTKEDDGLNRQWYACSTFINPPFGKNNGIIKWIRKMRGTAEKYPNYPLVMLLPARLETHWFQDYIWTPNYAYMRGEHIYVIKGRLKFVNEERNPMKYSHIVGSLLWMINISEEQLEKVTNTIDGILLTDYK